jgi:hypothetical protein
MISSLNPAFAFKNASPRRTALLTPEGLKRNGNGQARDMTRLSFMIKIPIISVVSFLNKK